MDGTLTEKREREGKNLFWLINTASFGLYMYVKSLENEFL